MFLAELYAKDEIQESIDLIQEIYGSFAEPRQSPDIQQFDPKADDPHKHLRKKAVRMYPGNNGVFKRAEHHLMKAQEKLRLLDPKKEHDRKIFQDVVQSVRKIKDILQQYKGQKA